MWKTSVRREWWEMSVRREGRSVAMEIGKKRVKSVASESSGTRVERERGTKSV